MISEDKVIKLFRIADEFSYDFASGCTINLLLEEKERRQHNSKEQWHLSISYTGSSSGTRGT